MNSAKLLQNTEYNGEIFDFYVSITTMRKYKVALDMLLESMPEDWKNKYILIYQDEEKEEYKVFEDGHIEVYLKNNISDYGNWVGVNILLENNVISDDSWFLFIHDTCKFIENSNNLTYEIINKYKNNEYDIIWLCNNGQCNLCIIRKNAIKYGYNIYKDVKYMDKQETIHYEWNHNHHLSVKSFQVKHFFIDIPTINLGCKDVYNTTYDRNILLYKSINIEKYYYHPSIQKPHPMIP
jgi:hypothetical protein